MATIKCTPEELRERNKLAAARYRATHRDEINARKRLVYRTQPEKRKAYWTKWYRTKGKISGLKWKHNNPEKVKESAKKSNERNAAKRRDAYVKYRARNKDKIAAYRKRYNAEHPLYWRMKNSERRAKIRNNKGVISANLVEKLWKLQKGKCACCGLPLGDDYHMDHIMPLALGGAHEDQNIQLLRRLCNQQKQAQHPTTFMQSRGFLL